MKKHTGKHVQYKCAGMIHVLGAMERDGVTFKTYELFICEIFHLHFWTAADQLKPQKSKPWIRGDYSIRKDCFIIYGSFNDF